MSGPEIEGAGKRGEIGPKVRGKSLDPEKVRGPEIEPADRMTTPAVAKSVGYKGLMGRLKKGF